MDSSASPKEVRALAADPILMLAASGMAGSLAPAAPLPAAAVCLAWWALFSRGRTWTCLAVLVFGVCAWRAEAKRQRFFADYEAQRLALDHPQICQFEAVIEKSPSFDLPDQADERPTQSLLVSAERLSCETKELTAPLLLKLRAPLSALGRQDRISLVADLAPVSMFRNAALRDPLGSVARTGAVFSGSVLSYELVSRGAGLPSYVDKFRYWVRGRILACYSPRLAPLARALVLGESDLSEGDSEAFSQSGLMHLLAVSGTHLIVAVLTLVRGLRALLLRLPFWVRSGDPSRWAALFGLGAALLYADFSGGSGSAWRAAFMLAVGLGLRWLGMRLSGTQLLACSLLWGLALEALVSSDISFMLSALATWGLLAYSRKLFAWVPEGLREGMLLGTLLEGLAATLASSFSCAPLLAMMDGRMTAAALLGNLLAGPLGELLALPACLLHTICFPWPDLELGLAQLGGGALSLVKEVALWSASVQSLKFVLPYPSPHLLALFCVGILALEWAKQRGGSLAARSACLVAALLAGAGSRYFSPRAILALQVLDIGQGDAMALELGTGETLVLDGGGSAQGRPDTGRMVMNPWLRARGVETLELMILSHAHPDHLEGLLAIAESHRVRRFWHPSGARRPSGSYLRLLQLLKAQGTLVEGPEELCGRPRQIGALELKILAPCPGPEGGSLNDESLVLRVEAAGTSFLLTGDIEHLGEARLLRTAGDALRSNVLKLPHHGSDTSSGEELLEAVQPDWAFVSSGVRNRFLHPRPSVIARLAERNLPVLRTDQQGSISLSVVDGQLQISTWKEAALGSWAGRLGLSSSLRGGAPERRLSHESGLPGK